MITFPKRARVLKRETAAHRAYKSKCGRYRIVHIEPYHPDLPQRWLAIHKLDNGNEEIINAKVKSKAGAERICNEHFERL